MTKGEGGKQQYAIWWGSIALSTCTALDNVAEFGDILNPPLERCVKAVKENYTAIVITLNNIYEETHQPEALGISKALSSKSTISDEYLLDYVLPQVAKLSKTLQSEKLDLTVISSLVEASLYSLDDALSPAANWVLELQDT